jgi:hypothetical protein
MASRQIELCSIARRPFGIYFIARRLFGIDFIGRRPFSIVKTVIFPFSLPGGHTVLQIIYPHSNTLNLRQIIRRAIEVKIGHRGIIIRPVKISPSFGQIFVAFLTFVILATDE